MSIDHGFEKNRWNGSMGTADERGMPDPQSNAILNRATDLDSRLQHELGRLYASIVRAAGEMNEAVPLKATQPTTLPGTMGAIIMRLNDIEDGVARLTTLLNRLDTVI